jgi:glutathione S-transferase
MTEAILTISSKNYSSWSLRGWLLCRMAGLEFVEEVAGSRPGEPRRIAAAVTLNPGAVSHP